MKRYLSFILLLALMLGIFSVSHAQVTTYPFVEGFEQGQTHGAQVQGWTQILGEYNNYWIANSRTISFNRTPRNGSFNATIRWESDAWIMREFTLQGGQSYDVEVWARQNTDVAADASIGLYYGTAATIADMTNTIVAQTGVIDGDYQRVWGSFTPDADGIYWIGIHGVVTTSPMYMSIDDFVVKHTPTGPVFTIIPTGYDFGSLKINTTGSKTFTMMNVGIGTLNISGISPTTDGFFTVTDAPGFPVTLAANETATFTIQYAPTEAGNHTGTFTFTDDTRAPTNFTVSGSCYDPTIYTFPWIEDFTDTTFPPEEWGRYEGLYPTDSLTPSTSRWYRAANFAGEEGNPSARINIYGNFTRHWLVTPPIAIPATGYQLDFDIALTTRNEGNPVYPYLQQDDRFIVLISDDPAMVGAQILREWNNTGSEHMYNDIATQGEFQVIDLSAHVGTKYIGFYAESTESGGDVHLYLDSVRVRETPSTPIFSLEPTEWDFGRQVINTTSSKTFTIMNAGGGTLNVTGLSPVSNGFFTVLNAPNWPVPLTTGQTASFTIQYAPTAAGNHTATFTISYDGGTADVTVSGECHDPIIYTYPFTEGFEAGQTDTTPVGGAWTQYRDDDKNRDWIANSSQTDHNRAPRNGSFNAYLTYRGNAWLMRPFSLQAEQPYYVEVWARQDGATPSDASVGLYYGSTGTVAGMTETIKVQTGVIDGDYQCVAGTFTPSATGIYWIGIHGIINSIPWFLSIDDIRVQLASTEVIPPILVSPADAATDVSVTPTFTWNVGAGAVPTSYNIYCDANSTPTTLIGTSTTNSFTPDAALPYSSTLYWTVTAENSNGTSAPAEPFSFTTMADPTVYAYPFTEGFETGQTDTTPVGGAWTQYRDDGSNRDWIANSSQTDRNRTPRSGSFNAYLYSGNAWLMRPFSLQAEQPYYVEVWARQDRANPSYASVGLYYGSTGTVAGMTETIKVQTGVIDGDYQCVAGTFTPSATGIYWIGIHGIIGVIRYLSIDDIRVQLASTEVLPPILVSPEDGATGLPKAGFDLTWQADSAGAAPASYAVYLASDPANIYDEHRWETTNISFNPVLEDDTFSFAYGQRYYWTVGAIFGGDEVVNEPPHFFDIEADPTVTTLPWTENFDSVPVDEMPVGWKIIASHTGADGRPWGVAEYSEVGAHSGTKCAIVIWHALYPKDEWMITPPISMQAGQSYNISFAVKGTGLDGVPESLALRWGTEPTVAAMTANPAVFDNNGAAYADWTMVNAMFTPPATGIYFFGWHAYTQASVFYIAVDTITISQCFDVDLAIVGTSGQTIGNVGEPVVRTVAVRNMGTTAQSNYTVYLKEAVTNNVLAQELITEIIDAGETVVHTLSWTPAAAGVVNLYAEVALAGDQELANNVTDPVEVTIYPANMELLFVGNPASNQGVHLFPFTAAYGDLVAETVYLASEMQATDGVIHQVAYYSYFAHDMTLSHNVQIWMKNTDTVNLEAGWLPWDGYQLVYDGPVEFTTGTHEIIIPLTTPFNYTGGNLAIRTSKTYDAAADPNIYNLWLLDTRGHYGYRTRYETSDAGELDHTNPTGTNVTYVYPNITFFMSTTNLVETVDAPVVTMTIAEPNALLDWELIPYAYGYNVYLAADPYNFGSIPAGTVYGAGAQINNITDAEKLFVKVTGVTYRDFNRAQALLRNLEPREIRLVDENLIGKAKQDLQVLTP